MTSGTIAEGNLAGAEAIFASPSTGEVTARIGAPDSSAASMGPPTGNLSSGWEMEFAEQTKRLANLAETSRSMESWALELGSASQPGKPIVESSEINDSFGSRECSAGEPTVGAGSASAGGVGTAGNSSSLIAEFVTGKDDLAGAIQRQPDGWFMRGALKMSRQLLGTAGPREQQASGTAVDRRGPGLQSENKSHQLSLKSTNSAPPVRGSKHNHSTSFRSSGSQVSVSSPNSTARVLFYESSVLVPISSITPLAGHGSTHSSPGGPARFIPADTASPQNVGPESTKTGSRGIRFEARLDGEGLSADTPTAGNTAAGERQTNPAAEEFVPAGLCHPSWRAVKSPTSKPEPSSGKDGIGLQSETGSGFESKGSSQDETRTNLTRKEDRFASSDTQISTLSGMSNASQFPSRELGVQKPPLSGLTTTDAIVVASTQPHRSLSSMSLAQQGVAYERLTTLNEGRDAIERSFTEQQELAEPQTLTDSVLGQLVPPIAESGKTAGAGEFQSTWFRGEQTAGIRQVGGVSQLKGEAMIESPTEADAIMPPARKHAAFAQEPETGMSGNPGSFRIDDTSSGITMANLRFLPLGPNGAWMIRSGLKKLDSGSQQQSSPRVQGNERSPKSGRSVYIAEEKDQLTRSTDSSDSLPWSKIDQPGRAMKIAPARGRSALVNASRIDAIIALQGEGSGELGQMGPLFSANLGSLTKLSTAPEIRELNGNPFLAMDFEPVANQGNSGLSLESARRELRVGVQDPEFGYLELRAHAQGGGVHAVLRTHSPTAGESLSDQLSSLAHWMTDRNTPAESLRVIRPVSSSDSALSVETAAGHSRDPSRDSQNCAGSDIGGEASGSRANAERRESTELQNSSPASKTEASTGAEAFRLGGGESMLLPANQTGSTFSVLA